jgi:hypothetical protein
MFTFYTKREKYMSNRFWLLILFVIGLLGWSGLWFFLNYVPPRNVMAISAFLLILAVSFIGTLTPFTYMVNTMILTRRQFRVTVRQALRQSTLLALVLVLNLVLLALRSWNIGMIFVTLGAAVVVEILILAKK